MNGYLSIPNVVEWVFGHLKSHVRQNDIQNHRTLLLHINVGMQAIVANMVQGWRREINQNFGSASHGE